jgi:hypothetical protein
MEKARLGYICICIQERTNAQNFRKHVRIAKSLERYYLIDLKDRMVLTELLFRFPPSTFHLLVHVLQHNLPSSDGD